MRLPLPGFRASIVVLSAICISITALASASPCPGDLTGDCTVNMDDFAVLASYWLNTSSPSSATGVYNIRDFGARGDSVTNDFPAVQSAITASRNTGGVLYFPPGSYRLANADITFPANVSVTFAPGASLYIYNINVAFNGPLTAGPYKIFDGSKTVTHLKKNSVILPEWWGADGSDTVADTHAFFAMAYLLKTCHTIQLDKNASYIIDSSFELPSQWSIVGGYDGPIGMNQAWDIPVFSKDAGRLAMRNNAAIWPQGSSSIKGVTFVKADLAWPQPNPDNYSGTAVQVNGEDVTINSCTFVGFGTGINSPAWDRLRLSDLNMDCKDFCVRIENSFDICYLQNIHCWPFGTAGQPGNFINRPGKGFYLKTACHGTGLTNCFAIGYKYGFWLESVATVHLSNCMADYDMNVNDGAVGFSVINSSFVRFNSCCAASMDIGFCFKGSSAIVVNADCFQLDSDCVRIDDPNSGTSYVSLSDSFFRNSQNGVVVNKNNSRVHINSCAFQALTGSAVINKLGTPTLVEYNNMNW